MKRSVLIGACLLALFFTGCKSEKTPGGSMEQEGNISFFNGSIQVDDADLFTMDFYQLQDALCEAIGLESDNMALREFYNVKPVDIIFTPEGKITQLNMAVWALDSEIGGDYIMDQYGISGSDQAGVSRLEISQIENDFHLAKEHFSFDFDGMAKFSGWMDEIDLPEILDTCIPEKASFYRIVTGMIPAEIVDSEGVSFTVLDCSGEIPEEIAVGDLSRVDEPGLYPLMFDSVIEYYAILPYYPAEKMSGCKVPLQGSEDGMMDYSAAGGGSYCLNHIVILFPEGEGIG